MEVYFMIFIILLGLFLISFVRQINEYERKILF